MAMRLEMRALSTRVGRRILGLFFFCALVPTGLLAAIGYLQVTSQLAAQSRERTGQTGKAAALSIMDGLQEADRALARLMREPIATSQGADTGWLLGARIDGAGDGAAIFGSLTPAPLTESDRERLDAGEPVLKVRSGGDPPEVLITRATRPGSRDDRAIWARVDMDSVVGRAALYVEGPASAGVCVLGPSREPIYCDGAAASPQARGAAAVGQDPYRGTIEWTAGRTRYLGAYYSLFLGAGWGAPDWTVIVGESDASVFEPAAAFRDAFIVTISAALTIVVLLSISQIRRSLVPLEKLKAAADALSVDHVEARVRIRSRDEFRDVGEAFNRMAERIGSQVSDMQTLLGELDDLSWGALQALARSVDAMSPWTAGHSERVASVAVEIGKQMALSEREIDLLHRGGLLHDIGKLGVPSDILDKPGKLTDEEFDAIKRHPVIGAEILAPVARFEELIPLARSHHERVDGTGYPDGLVGDQINPYARILAVADVFDACSANRPYRDGIPLERVADIIREGSGSQFDPVVVEAFMRWAEPVLETTGALI